MRVLHFFKTYRPDTFGGIEQVIYEIAEGSAARGIDVDVLALSPQPASAPLWIGQHQVYQSRQDLYIASTGISFSAPSRFRKLAAQADLIHYHFPWPFMDLVQLTSRTNRPFVVTYHSDIVRQKRLVALYRPLMDRFLGQAAAIVATSPDYFATSPALQRHAGKVSVIPIGLDESTLDRPTQADRAALQQRLPELYFLFLGALRYYKGLTYLIEAARRTALPVVIAGIGEMQAEIEAARLPNVTFLGKVSEREKIALLEGAYAFVFPSHLRSEAFGVALLEAAMMGRAMICCRLGTGTTYVNVDGETGLVVPPADPDALASAMQRLWSSPDETARMGAKARARYERLFTADVMSDAYIALYHHILERRAALT